MALNGYENVNNNINKPEKIDNYELLAQDNIKNNYNLNNYNCNNRTDILEEYLLTSNDHQNNNSFNNFENKKYNKNIQKNQEFIHAEISSYDNFHEKQKTNIIILQEKNLLLKKESNNFKEKLSDGKHSDNIEEIINNNVNNSQINFSGGHNRSKSHKEINHLRLPSVYN